MDPARAFRALTEACELICLGRHAQVQDFHACVITILLCVVIRRLPKSMQCTRCKAASCSSLLCVCLLVILHQ